MGFLCLSWSRFSLTPATSHAEHKGLIGPVIALFIFCIIACSYLRIYKNHSNVFDTEIPTNFLLIFFSPSINRFTICFLSFLYILDCWTIHGTLCICPWSCKVSQLCTLDPSGLTLQTSKSCRFCVWVYDLPCCGLINIVYFDVYWSLIILNIFICQH